MRYDLIKFNVYGQLLKQYNSLPIVENTLNYMRLKFTFSDEWTDKIKTAVFEYNGRAYGQILIDDECYIPHEALHLPGFKFAVFAAEGNQVIRTTAKFMHVLPSSAINIQETVIPTPDIYQQILELFKQCKLTAGDGIAIVDGVISVASVFTEAQSRAEFPEVGQAGKLYIDVEDSAVYRWDAEAEEYVIAANDWHKIEVIDSDARYS